MEFKKKRAKNPDSVRGWQTTLKPNECLILGNGVRIYNPESHRIRIMLPNEIELQDEPHLVLPKKEIE